VSSSSTFQGYICNPVFDGAQIQAQCLGEYCLCIFDCNIFFLSKNSTVLPYTKSEPLRSLGCLTDFLCCIFSDTVGMLARVIGGEHFYPISEEWIKISLVRFVIRL
jgi:hypothetical protein